MKDEETTTDNHSKILETWGKYIGFLLAVGGLLNLIASNEIVAIILLTIGCFLVEVWLWNIWRQGEYVKKSIIEGKPLPPVIYTENQRKTAKVFFYIIFVVYAFLLIFLTIRSFQSMFRKPRPTPTLTEIVTSISQPTPTPTFTLIPVILADIPTATFTPLPSSTNTPTSEPVLLIKQDCFNSNNWTPYEYLGSSVFVNDNGCWNLNYWGFTARDKGMIIIPPISPKGIGHGIYTPIQDAASIKLSITVKEFNIHPVNSANIAIGVVDNKMPGLSHSRVIYYHYIPEVSADHISIKTGEDAEYKDSLTSTLVIGETQDIYMQLDGPFLTVTINGEVIELTIPFEQRAFWISYSVPDNGELVALISNLEIK